MVLERKGMEILYYSKSFNVNYKKGRLITSYAFLVVLFVCDREVDMELVIGRVLK